MDNVQLSQTDVFLAPHDYELFLPSQEIDTSLDNHNHLKSPACENLCQDDLFFTHATNLGLQFALPHFMVQHNYEDLKSTDDPITVPTFIKVDNGHEFKLVCAHKPFTSQVDPNKYSNYLVSPSLHTGKHKLKASAEDMRTQEYPVNWFKLISSMHSKTNMSEPQRYDFTGRILVFAEE